MVDNKGDSDKQPPGCAEDLAKCPNMQCTYEGWDKESYNCYVCGASYNLYYEDMQ